jgi:hypothetical protein
MVLLSLCWPPISSTEQKKIKQFFVVARKPGEFLELILVVIFHSLAVK